ncbi:MAG: hypothetical protein CME66_04925 [Halobacteriovoraceae bacterium]|jgi:23S rRNA (cytosine1962-C5)-methyltransferase|nr:hypothetical protein [Halobacteriovoraceae bacterium]
MYHTTRQQIKTYDIHPTSIKQIQKGHPWITVDKFSENFHPKERFIVASNRKRPFALLLHDPTHKFVRARVWATDGNFQKQMKSFKNDLAKRIRVAINKRAKAPYKKERNHYYLIFAESDQIPGVNVHFLNGEILIQFYMDFWNQYQDYFIQTLLKSINENFNLDLTYENIWIQKRSLAKEPAKCLDPNASFKHITINEFGVDYKVTLGKFYDHGIYTDMASIRKKMEKQLKASESLLNLYSYTGAFSLYALQLGLKKVTSVDLSETYLNWLEENINLNTVLEKDNHESKMTSTLEALNELKDKKEKYDFIISDPPSSSSDGNKRSNALQDYKETLPLMEQVLSEKGQILAFINTHKCSMRKFEDKLKRIIESKKLNLKIVNKYYLSEDCPYKKGFPEGSYLKGLLLKRND